MRPLNKEPIRSEWARADIGFELMADADHVFISSAVHYYVAGRYAMFAGLNPTAANLLHHAVEMAFKAALSKKGMTLAALRKLNHNLLDIWAEFKTQHGGGLDKFDKVITELHKYEEIRYPDKIVAHGMRSVMGRGKSSTSKASVSSQRPEPEYTLQLGDVDELMDKVFTLASISHKAYTNGLLPVARQYLTAENEEAGWN
jgi:hypothetical protein